MLAVGVEELAQGVVEAAARHLQVAEHGLDSLLKPAGQRRQLFVLARKVAGLRRGRRVAGLEALEDQVLLGMVVEVRVVEAIVDHAPDDVVVRGLAGVEHRQLALERVEQLRQIGMVFVDRVQDVGHRESPVAAPKHLHAPLG